MIWPDLALGAVRAQVRSQSGGVKEKRARGEKGLDFPLEESVSVRAGDPRVERV
jgi:hypothetical protein